MRSATARLSGAGGWSIASRVTLQVSCANATTPPILKPGHRTSSSHRARACSAHSRASGPPRQGFVGRAKRSVSAHFVAGTPPPSLFSPLGAQMLSPPHLFRRRVGFFAPPQLIPPCSGGGGGK